MFCKSTSEIKIQFENPIILKKNLILSHQTM